MTGWVLENVKTTPAKKLILWALADRANDDGSGAWPAVESMATWSCSSRRTVQRSLRELEDEGKIVNEGKGPKGTTNWRVVVPWYEADEGRQNDTPTSNGGASSATSGGDTVTPEPVQEPTHRVSTDVETVVQPTLDGSTEDPAEVFDYWRKVMGKTGNVVLNAKRRSAIKARLAEGYTVEDLKLAVDGCKNTPHNMGQNDRGRPFNDIELICRNGPNVERFRDAAGAPSSVKRDRHRLGQTSTIDDDAVFEKSRAALNGR